MERNRLQFPFEFTEGKVLGEDKYFIFLGRKRHFVLLSHGNRFYSKVGNFYFLGQRIVKNVNQSVGRGNITVIFILATGFKFIIIRFNEYFELVGEKTDRGS